jgi:hypothetical protein
VVPEGLVMHTDDQSHHDVAITDPACPRCGYDVRASMTTWTDSCPRTGTCSECGLEFEWGRVLRPGRFAPLWCVEFEPRPRRIPQASWRTLLRSLRPWRFWSQMHMTHDVRPTRILAYLGCLVLAVLVLFALWRTALATYVYFAVSAELRGAPGVLQSQATNLRQRVPALKRLLAIVEQFDPTSETSEWPTPDPTLGRGYERWFAQVAGLPRVQWPEHRGVIIREISANIIQMETVIAAASAVPPGRLIHSWPAAAFEGVAIPFSRASGGTVFDPSGQWTWYPPPVELVPAAAALAKGGRAGGVTFWGVGRDFHEIRGVLILLGGAGCFVAWLIPASMIVLPISRGRAKVRWAHIGRVAAYSMFIPILALPAAITAQNLGLVFDGQQGLFTFAAFSIVTFAVTAAYILWWWMAISRYLRIPHGLLVAFLLTVMSALLVPAMMVLFSEILGVAR